MEYYYYLIFFFIIIIIFRLYVKITYKFWAYQPVFHYYNLLYWIYPIGIINKELPESNKFCNFINITTKNLFDYTDTEIEEIINLLKIHYNRNSDANYLPNKNNFINHFIGHTSKSYISVYNNNLFKLDNEKKENINEKKENINEKKENIIEKKENINIIKEKEIIGVITGRPINITLKNIKKKFNGYYVDFLCVNKEHRNKNIAPQLIQTYEYAQRHDNTESSISLFKREGKLTGIVPLTIYKTYMFHAKNIKPKIINDKLIKISKLNFDLITDFIDANKNNFDCIITINKSNLLNLIIKNIYTIYCILLNKKVVACYFFKENQMTYNIKKSYDTKYTVETSIDLVLSVNNTDNNTFIEGFKNSLNKFDRYYINIENISNNNIIVDYLLYKSLIPEVIAPIAYFFYNYANRPIPSKQVFILV